MEPEKKIIVYCGYVYEAGEKQLNEKEMRYAFDELSGSLKHLNNVLNMVKDGNQKKAVSKSMKNLRDLFNNNIKDPSQLYAPKSVEDMAKTAKTVDAQMKEKQGISDFSHNDDATFEDKSSMNP
jgi:hypothetical protein